MKKKIKSVLVLIMVTLFLHTLADGSGSTVDLSKMTPEQIMEFYIKNPDYGKKRVGIDYNAYKDGNYVVWRGELYDKDGVPMENFPVNFIFNKNQYSYISNKDGVFNLELDKKEITDEKKEYSLKIVFDTYSIESRKLGKELLDKSIYHFKFSQDKENEKWRVDNIYNNAFMTGSANFNLVGEKIYTYSPLGIQGFWLIFFVILGFFTAGFIYFKTNFKTTKG